MPTADKRNNVLFVGIDKVALAAILGVTPSYVRQMFRGERGNQVQLEKMEHIIEEDLRRLRLESLKARDLLGGMIGAARHGR